MIYNLRTFAYAFSNLDSIKKPRLLRKAANAGVKKQHIHFQSIDVD